MLSTRTYATIRITTIHWAFISAKPTLGALERGLESVFELDADLRFIGEHFYRPGVSAKLFGSALESRYDIPIGSNGVDLNFQEQFIPVFNQSKAWISNGTASLVVPFAKSWGVTAQFFDNYLRNAPYTFRRNYLKTTIGISYTPASK